MLLPEDKHRSEIPNNYFNNINSELEKKLLEEETFNTEDYPTLFSIIPNNDFSLPVDYFKEFNPDIYIAKTTGTRFNILTIAASILIAVFLFALSIKREMPESIDVSSEEMIEYFASEDIELIDLYSDDLEFLILEENETSFAEIEEEILFDFLIEDIDQIDLAWLY